MSVTSAQVLACPMPPNDAGAATVQDYLVSLLVGVWRDGEGFDGKRPFGNSSWEYDLYVALARAGMVESATEGSEGEFSHIDEDEATLLIADAIESLRRAHAVPDRVPARRPVGRWRACAGRAGAATGPQAGGVTAATLVDHRRVESDDPFYDGPPRCECGSWWPCDAVTAAAVAEAAARADLGMHGHRGTTDRFLLDRVSTGWALWEIDPNECLDFHPRGGIVVDIRIDEDDRRVFTLAHNVRGRVELVDLNEDQVAPPGDGALPNSAFMREIARAMKREKFTGLVDGHEIRVARYTLALLEVAA